MSVTTIGDATLYLGDCREVLSTLPDQSVQTCITSPPYFGLRDYGVEGQIGLEATPAEFVAQMVAVFREVRRVLRDDGTLWLNLGDSYAAQRGGTAMPAETLAGGVSGNGCVDAHRGRGSTHAHRNASGIGLKHKDLIGIPWRVAFALQSAGWYLRSDIIWSKPNPMPESVTDRPTKAHEYLFLLAKSERYYFDALAFQEPATGMAPGNRRPTKAAMTGAPEHRTAANLHEIEARETRNRRTVWTVPTHPFSGAHFATFPPDLIRPCVLAGAPPGGVVLDPFNGAGTTGMVALQDGRRYIGIELNPEYLHEIAAPRIRAAAAQPRLFA